MVGELTGGRSRPVAGDDQLRPADRAKWRVKTILPGFGPGEQAGLSPAGHEPAEAVGCSNGPGTIVLDLKVDGNDRLGAVVVDRPRKSRVPVAPGERLNRPVEGLGQLVLVCLVRRRELEHPLVRLESRAALWLTKRASGRRANRPAGHRRPCWRR